MKRGGDSPDVVYRGDGSGGGRGGGGNSLRNGGRRGMVVVGRKRRVARFVPLFPDLAGTENGICSL